MRKIKILVVLLIVTNSIFATSNNSEDKIIYDFDFFPHDSHIAFTLKNKVEILNIQSGNIIDELINTKEENLISIDISNDSSVLITGSNKGLISIWDLQKKEILHEKRVEGAITDIKIDNQIKTFAAACSNGVIYKFDIQSLNIQKEFIGHRLDVTSLEFITENNFLISSSADKSIIIWNYKTGETVNQLTQHKSWIRDIAFNGNDRMVSCGDDGRLLIWNISDIKNIKLLESRKVSRYWITNVSYYNDGNSILYSTIKGHVELISPYITLKKKYKTPILKAEFIYTSGNKITLFLASMGNGYEITGTENFKEK